MLLHLDIQYKVYSDTIQFERELLATNIVFNRQDARGPAGYFPPQII